MEIVREDLQEYHLLTLLNLIHIPVIVGIKGLQIIFLLFKTDIQIMIVLLLASGIELQMS